MTTISFKLPDDQARRLMDAAKRQGMPAEEWLRNQVREMLSRDASAPAQAAKKSTLAKARGLAKTENAPPDDEQVKYWIHDHKTKKYGGV